MITLQQLLDAPDWAIFHGPATPTDMRRDQWEAFDGDGPEDLDDRLRAIGYRSLGDIERCDEECQGTAYTDEDAWLACLNAGGTLCKVPDEPGSPYSRMYSVRAVTTVRVTITLHVCADKPGDAYEVVNAMLDNGSPQDEINAHENEHAGPLHVLSAVCEETAL